ncbi:MAG TPA: FAD-dependent oxidoreductase [Flavobacteriaceae bacterium]|nr:FAD-dependent oxidoreductase [Flavobacteriaceae bacterium]
MYDYLIVGFGLGGMHFANYLLEENKKFVVFDDQSQKASKVAGGLCNPIALNKFSLIPNGDRNLQLAVQTYKSLEQKLGIEMFSDMPIHQKFDSEEQRNKWFSASQKTELKSFLNPKLIPFHAQIKSKYEFGEVMQSYLVRLPELMHSFKEYLQRKKCYSPLRFDHLALKIEKDCVIYKNFRARNIIFCEGFGLKQNPFFNYLPLAGNKGEYIIIHSTGLKLKKTIKSSYFLIPLGNDCYKFGATYDREFRHSKPTEMAKNKLTTALENLIDCPYTLLDHIAGIRPTTSDHSAFVGPHPKFSNVYVCNGFGSRGILTAPGIVQQLIDFIQNKKPLSSEIDVARFQKKYIEPDKL